MEKMLAANRDLHEIRAGRISEELAVSVLVTVLIESILSLYF